VKNSFRLLIAAPSVEGWWNHRTVLAPPRALPLLAGLTPPHIHVELVDENIREVDLTKRYDAVALSVMTPSAPRAYALADHFRSHGIPVIMGGIHPTVMPDEAAEHADAIGIREAENYWPEIISDLEAGRLKSRYQAPFHDMKGLPRPRIELLEGRRYLTTRVIETTRGCPYDCAYCSVSAVAGKRYRQRPIGEVVEEIRRLREYDPRWIGFTDDNIAGDHVRAKKLFEALIPFGIRWAGQADVKVSTDKELLTLAYRSGCAGLFMGIESANKENYEEIGKTPNLQVDSGEAIRNVQRAGIAVIGSFILGLDRDGLSIFDETYEFARKYNLAAAQFSVLTPYPGTRLRKQMEREERILTDDWAKYTFSDVVFQPKNMTPEALKLGQRQTYLHFYSWSSIFSRCLLLPVSPVNRLLAFQVNRSYRSIQFKQGLTGGLPGSK